MVPAGRSVSIVPFLSLSIPELLYFHALAVISVVLLGLSAVLVQAIDKKSKEAIDIRLKECNIIDDLKDFKIDLRP